MQAACALHPSPAQHLGQVQGTSDQKQAAAQLVSSSPEPGNSLACGLWDQPWQPVSQVHRPADPGSKQQPSTPDRAVSGASQQLRLRPAAHKGRAGDKGCVAQAERLDLGGTLRSNAHSQLQGPD